MTPIRRRPIPRTRTFPEVSQHFELILNGAVRKYRDGREVCVDARLLDVVANASNVSSSARTFGSLKQSSCSHGASRIVRSTLHQKPPNTFHPHLSGK